MRVGDRCQTHRCAGGGVGSTRITETELASSRLKLRVYAAQRRAHDGQRAKAGGSGVGCGAAGLAPGLPPWATYALTSSPDAGVTVLMTGPKPIYYRRSVGPAGQTPSGSITFIGGPTGDHRLAYLAAAAGIDAANMPVRGYEQHPVAEDGSLDREVTRIRKDLLVRYQRLMRMLVDRNIVPVDAVADLPPIDLEVEDHRRPGRTSHARPVRHEPVL